MYMETGNSNTICALIGWNEGNSLTSSVLWLADFMYKDAFETEPNQSEEVVKECRVKRIIKEIMDERGIYEIRKSQIQNFYIESFSDEWLLVVKNLTRKETPSTNSIAIPHAALMRLWEIVSDKITLHEKSRKL